MLLDCISVFTKQAGGWIVYLFLQNRLGGWIVYLFLQNRAGGWIVYLFLQNRLGGGEGGGLDCISVFTK